MKKSIVIVLSILCAVILLALPFILSSPGILGETYMELMESLEGCAFPSVFTSANAEEEAPEEPAFAAGKVLPLDYTLGGSTPDEYAFTDSGYEDDTIRVTLETVEKDGVIWRLAYVRIADASQLRTAVAGKPAVTSTREALPSSMAQNMNAIVAIGGDNFANEPNKKTFEYRQGIKINAARNNQKDALIIDENGDFHTVIGLTAEHMTEALDELEKDGHTIINAFTFGPVLVKDGEEVTVPENYGYNPNAREPRCAIGQTGPLAYVLILAEGRSDSSTGVTQQELAAFAASLGCKEAYNLDGGNSAVLIYHNEFYMNKTNKERTLNDIIYFASATEQTPQE